MTLKGYFYTSKTRDYVLQKINGTNNRVFLLYKKRNISPVLQQQKGTHMKEKKEKTVCLRITETQDGILNAMIAAGLAKNTSQAIQYLINLYGIKGSM